MALSYKAEITSAMSMLSQNSKTRFIGYGIATGSRAGGSLSHVPREQCIETTVAEHLMVGIGIGMAIMGYRPVVFIERADFLLQATDAIVNHLDKLKALSAGEYSPTMIIRVVVGNKTKPLFTGPTHTQDFSEAFKRMVGFPVIRLTEASQVMAVYNQAFLHLRKHSTMIFEMKDLY